MIVPIETEHPATSLAKFLNSHREQYRAMVGASSLALEDVLDARRRYINGRPPEVTGAIVAKVFSLYWEKSLSMTLVGEKVGFSQNSVWKILHRKHPMSVNHPKHKNET
jgi:hypothetical protein